MSQFDNKKAAALKYDGTNKAPVVVASGSGHIAQKIVEVAQDNKVPVYQDNSLATLLSQLKLGSEIPPELYKAIVEIYVYFLNFTSPTPAKNEVTKKEEELHQQGEEKLPQQGEEVDILVGEEFSK